MSNDLENEQPLPWYKKPIPLDRKAFRIGKFTRVFLIITLPIILFHTVSVKPLWQVGWRWHLYGFGNSMPLRMEGGRWAWGGAWIRSREIRVYGAPGVPPEVVRGTAAGMASLVEELGLDISVRVTPPPEGAWRDYDAAVVEKGGKYYFDFHRFFARRLRVRGGRYAELVVVTHPYLQSPWAAGEAFYPAGLATLQKTSLANMIRHTARHEGAHLLGYNLHDDAPIEVFGYREHWFPDDRQTLMHPKSFASDALSPRARDAILNYWRGAEDRLGMRFFGPKMHRPPHKS